MSEFMELFGEWGNDIAGVPLPLKVETLIRRGQLGDVYAPPVERPGLPQMPQKRLVRTSTGNEVTSSTAIYAPQEDAALFPLGSRVTLADGRQAAVLTLAAPDAFGLFGFLVVNVE